MKRFAILVLGSLFLTSCNGWVIQPQPYNQPTPIIPPSSTPAIYSPTPVVIGHSSTPDTFTVTSTFIPTNSNVQTSTVTITPENTSTPTSFVDAPAIQIKILGCNTSIDITHGMGEVTNAFVELMNIGNVELTNLVVTLYALDEGREHPDKIQEVAFLPLRYQVTLKLTVDSTYKQESAIQVEVVSDQMLFPREGSPSCRDIGLLAPNPTGLSTPVTVNP